MVVAIVNPRIDKSVEVAADLRVFTFGRAVFLLVGRGWLGQQVRRQLGCHGLVGLGFLFLDLEF